MSILAREADTQHNMLPTERLACEKPWLNPWPFAQKPIEEVTAVLLDEIDRQERELEGCL